MPGVTRTAQKRARHGGFVPLRQETSRHWRGDWVAAQARASTGCVSSGSRRRVRGRPCRAAAGRLEHWRAEQHLQVGRDAQGIRQLGAMQCATQCGVVAELGVPNHRGDVNRAARTCRHSVTAMCHFGSKRPRRNTGPRPLRRRQPFSGTYNSLPAATHVRPSTAQP